MKKKKQRDKKNQAEFINMLIETSEVAAIVFYGLYLKSGSSLSSHPGALVIFKCAACLIVLFLSVTSPEKLSVSLPECLSLSVSLSLSLSLSSCEFRV